MFVPLARKWLLPLLYLVFPRYCALCGRVLRAGEDVLCADCTAKLPRTGFHTWDGNPVEKRFWGKFSLGRASAFLHYKRGSATAQMVHKLKYGGRDDIGEALGRQMAGEMMPSGFFDGVDCLIPIPLHREKQRERGYNQVLAICLGLSEVTGIPVDSKSVSKVRHTESMTQMSSFERTASATDMFVVDNVERFAGRHIMIVDDVVTTSSTITACADAFAGAEDLTISVLTLAVADT